MSTLPINPKYLAVKGLGELVDEAVRALRDCLDSEDDDIKFAAAKFVMEKMTTPKATHSFIDPGTQAYLDHLKTQDIPMNADNMLVHYRAGRISMEEVQAYLDAQKAIVDLSRQQETLNQIARIKELENRKSQLIILQSDQQRLEEAMA